MPRVYTWQKDLLLALDLSPSSHTVISCPRQAGATTFAHTLELQHNFEYMDWRDAQSRPTVWEKVDRVLRGERAGLVMDNVHLARDDTAISIASIALRNHCVVRLTCEHDNDDKIIVNDSWGVYCNGE